MKRRLFRLRTRSGIPEEVDREVRFHLERKIEALVASGLSRAEAEQAALERFGDVERAREEMAEQSLRRERRMRRAEWREGWGQDVRYAVRQLARHRLFTAVAVVTLALGIGVNTAIFSVVDGILFRPLPYPEPHELVNVWSDVTERGGPPDEWLSYANFHDLREGSRTLDALSAWGGWAPTWTDGAEPLQLAGAQVTQGMFDRVLEVDPALGRGFAEEDDLPGAPPVVLLSHAFWTRAFGADSTVVGRNLTLDDRSAEVIGVMPADFRPPFVPDADLWTVPGVDAAAQEGRRGNFSWRAVGRLADDTPVEVGAAEIGDLGTALAEAYPESNAGMSFRAVSLREDVVKDARAGLLVLLGAVGLVLLIACVNVANLLLARASGREGELAVRSALGAGRTRIVRQLLTEALVLAVAGGLVGVVLALFTTDLLVSLAPQVTPRLAEISVDGRVLAFTGTATLAAGLIFGVVPALRVATADLHGTLREGGRGQVGARGTAVRSALVAGQVALAIVLLIGAGLLVESLRNLRTADLGFDPKDVVTARIGLPGSRYPSAEERAIFARDLEARLAAIPGVESVGSTNTVPLTGFDGDVTFFVENHPVPAPTEAPAAWFRRVTPGYFETMRIEIVEGRSFDESDREGDFEVLIVNQTLADAFFPNESAVGKRITFNPPDSEDVFWREIVGVAHDVRNFGIREGSRYAAYSPWDQTPGGVIFPVLRAGVDVEGIMPGVRRAVAEIDPALAVASPQALEEIVASRIAPERFVASLVSLFAGVALILAVIGLYGVVAYRVSARTRELGVRMALGADRSRISWMVVGGTLLIVAVGAAIGVVGAVAAGRLMGTLLFGVNPTDPLVYTGVVGALFLAALVASAVPAFRATRVDPTTALRSE